MNEPIYRKDTVYINGRREVDVDKPSNVIIGFSPEYIQALDVIRRESHRLSCKNVETTISVQVVQLPR